MKKKLLKRALLISICAVLLTSGAGAVYVTTPEGGSAQLPSMQNAAAIGGDGTESSLTGDNGTYYAVTASGLETIVETVAREPQHISVSGNVKVTTNTIRVGLYWGDDALECANLANVSGSGYSFGYYDSSRVFHEVGGTTQTAITMSMDKNVTANGVYLGCYHILLGDTYSDFASAQSAASAYYGGFPAWYNGTYRVLVGNYSSAADATSDAASRGISGTAYSASNKCVTVSVTGSANIIFEFDGGSGSTLAVSPRATGTQKTTTLFKNLKYYGSFEYSRRDGDKLTVTNILPLDDYVKGVLPYEMSKSWPLEALKAQAVCARSYVLRNINAYASLYGFDVTNTSASQVYRGTNASDANSDRAVDETAGVVAVYNGSIINAVYSSSHGGGSENSENVWGGSEAYLRGVLDPYEQAAASVNSYSSWTRSKSESDVCAALSKCGLYINSVAYIAPTYSATGNIIGMSFTSAAGTTVSVSGTTCNKLLRTYLGLPAIHATATLASGYVVFSGSGWGHSLGLSQWGAYAMAGTYGFTYDQILSFYYTGIGLCYGVS